MCGDGLQSSLSLEAIEEIDFEVAKRDFKFFFEEILGFQLSHHHERWYNNLEERKRYCVKAARDHGKSTLFLGYMLWKTAFNPKTKAVLISHSLHQSIHHMRTLNDLIDSVPFLAKMKKADSWSKTFFGFSNGSNISAKSVGGAIRGIHPDLILCDDILWGTTDTELESRDGYLVETYPAINKKGEALWPERWDLESLDARRADMPAVAFAREYLCEPMDDVSSLFPSTVMQTAKDNTLKLIERETGDPDDQYFIGWDPAISSDRSADYTVMVVLRRPSTNPELLELVHVVRRKNMDFRTQIMEIQRLNAKFSPDVIELEANNFQRVFATELRADTDLPIKTFISTRQRRESLLMGLVLRFENEQMRLPWGDDNSRTVVSELERELMMFGMSKKGRLDSIGRHDDFAIALALAHWATTEFRERVVDIDDMMAGMID